MRFAAAHNVFINLALWNGAVLRNPNAVALFTDRDRLQARSLDRRCQLALYCLSGLPLTFLCLSLSLRSFSLSPLPPSAALCRPLPPSARLALVLRRWPVLLD